MAFFYEVWLMLQMAAPYILIGFLAAGLIHTFVPQSWIVSLIGKRNWKSVLTASICGVPLPLCSCSVLPMAATLRKKGAGRGGTTAFLISTPETGVDSIALTYGLMNLPMAVLRPLAAFLTAFLAGITVNRWGEQEDNTSAANENCPRCGNNTPNVSNSTNPGKPWWSETARYAFIDLPNDLAHWLALGFVLSGVIALWIPDWIFQSWAGQGFSSLLIMLAVSMPMYICASGSTPIAAVMMAKGLSPGAALVFLLAGPATNISSLPVLVKILGRRATLLYLLSIIVVSLAIGNFVNLYVTVNDITPQVSIHHAGNEEIGLVGSLAGLLFLLLLIKGMWKRPVPKEWQQFNQTFKTYIGFHISWKLVFTILALMALFSILQMCVLIVGPGEIGLIQQLGKPTAVNLSEGLHVHWPPPIDKSQVLRVNEVRTVEIGFRLDDESEDSKTPPSAEDAIYLTSDENMLDITAQGDYRVKDAAVFVFEIANPDRMIYSAIQSALTETLASMKIDTAYTTARREIESRTAERARAILHVSMPNVVELMNVRLVRVHAPANVHQAFRDVASAEEDRLKQINEALVDQERQLHLVRGEAAERLENAEAKRYSRIQQAIGESQSFTALAKCDLQWPNETRTRLRFETIDQTLLFVSKTIVPNAARRPGFELWIMDSNNPVSTGK
ncbi:MAG: hypothetical protein C4527_19080 [Candidatus Omnitrophota bacterium]|jgi:uncharacterized membrane protein YraQ (UPF0718 family)/regulator of protease activity HflC (stomatin/prohibitin superfamily)|nr:MAG: hypothetical protein C4527_19080 [Candidatus Omnitrophota bacterium]